MVECSFEQLAYMAFGLQVLDDTPIFSCRACCQEKGSFVCKPWLTEEVKAKAYIFDYKRFTNSIFKMTATGLEHTTTLFINEHSTI